METTFFKGPFFGHTISWPTNIRSFSDDAFLLVDPHHVINLCTVHNSIEAPDKTEEERNSGTKLHSSCAQENEKKSEKRPFTTSIRQEEKRKNVESQKVKPYCGPRKSKKKGFREQKYVCDICEAAFTLRHNVQAHLLTFHIKSRHRMPTAQPDVEVRVCMINNPYYFAHMLQQIAANAALPSRNLDDQKTSPTPNKTPPAVLRSSCPVHDRKRRNLESRISILKNRKSIFNLTIVSPDDEMEVIDEGVAWRPEGYVEPPSKVPVTVVPSRPQKDAEVITARRRTPKKATEERPAPRKPRNRKATTSKS
ncbi:unnamed protein product [Caenorhabditis auriculariae]|uniref:C2H2-type domain-containing protein n=1 Tax=Caenorhabditis auriculariae TaxID=2777116 RepID=A0A8S1HKK4_9PELO|nr:unnamed protein product [Caenorhabditis auriculariae]